jgi:predicted nucleotidyltransferase
MAEVKSEILNVAKKYVDLLNQSGFPISEAYLYGSYSNGTATIDSDIDIAIVSNKFEGNRYLDKVKIRCLYRKIDLRLSAYPFTKTDLTDNPFAAQEIVKKGIRIV